MRLFIVWSSRVSYSLDGFIADKDDLLYIRGRVLDDKGRYSDLFRLQRRSKSWIQIEQLLAHQFVHVLVLFCARTTNRGIYKKNKIIMSGRDYDDARLAVFLLVMGAEKIIQTW